MNKGLNKTYLVQYDADQAVPFRKNIKLRREVTMKKVVMIIAMIVGTMMMLHGTYHWLGVTNGGGLGADTCNGMDTDASGNIYIIGDFTDTASFGGTSLVSSGSSDIYVAKLQSDLNWLWATRAGGTGFVKSRDISTDSSGNSFVTGRFQGTISFGETTLTCAAGFDIFIAKLDNSGNWLWAKQIGGTGFSYNWGMAIATDADGNCYTTGSFENSVTIGDTTLVAGGDNQSGMYLAKLDPNGNWLWVRQAGTSGWGLAIDASGNIYVGGNFRGTLTMGSITLNSGTSSAIYVAKLDGNGNWIWANKAVGSAGPANDPLSIDASGNIYLIGSLNGEATFGGYYMATIEDIDFFVAKLSPTGSWLWAYQVGELTTLEYGTSIANDTSGFPYCWISGAFEGYIAISPSYVLNNGSLFVARIEPDGHNWGGAWAAVGQGVFLGSRDIATDANNNLYVVGGFDCSATFGNFNVFSNGNTDAFIAKFGYSSDNEDNLAPDANAALIGSYPNPFDTQSVIEYDIKVAAPVKIGIYNLKGQLIKTLINETKTSGTYSTIWNGQDNNNNKVSNGVYYCKLTSGKVNRTSKLILIR